MARQLKIGADTSEFKKSILDLSHTLNQSLGKTRAQFIDKQTIDFFSKGAGQAIDKISRRIEKLKTLTSEWSKRAQDTVKGSQEEVKAKQKTLSLMKQIIGAERNRSAIQKAQKHVEEGRGGLANILSRMPGAGRLFGRFGVGGAGHGMFGRVGMLGRGALGAGGLTVASALGAGVLGAGAFAAARMGVGYGRYRSSADERLALRARFQQAGIGGAPTAGRNKSLQALGYTPGEIRQAQLQATNIFGAKGSTQAAVGQRMGFARQTGMNIQQLQGAGAGLRAAIGTSGANREMIRLMATTQAAEIKTAIGPWLETTANMISNIKESGLAFDDSALMALGTLVGKDKFSPERAAKLITGVNKAIQSSSGPQRAFFMGAFASGGIGTKGGMAGLDEAVNLGLFGMSATTAKSTFTDEAFKAYKHLNLLTDEKKGESGKRAGLILRQVNKMTAGVNNEDQRELAKGRIVQAAFHLQSGGEAQQVIKILTKMSKTAADPKAQAALKRQLENLTASPEKKNLDLMTSQEGHLKAIEALLQAASENLGETITPLIGKMVSLLPSIDKGIAKVFGIVGFESGEQKFERRISEGKLTKSEINKRFSTEGMKRNFLAEQNRDIAANEERLNTINNFKGSTMDLLRFTHGNPEAEKQYLEKNTQTLKEQRELTKQQLDEQIKHRKATEEAARKAAQKRTNNAHTKQTAGKSNK